jgi:predicted Zn-dependent protease
VNKILLCMVAVLVLSGCQQKESAQNNGGPNVEAQRKEAARKVTQQAMMLLSQEKYQEAVAALDAAIKLDPTDQDPYLMLGQILLKAGEYDRAVDFLDNAAKNFPNNGMVFYMLSIANRMDGKKLPAVLAARRSFEIFKGAGDKEGAEKAALLLEQIINTPDDKTKKTASK